MFKQQTDETERICSERTELHVSSFHTICAYRWLDGATIYELLT